MRDQLPRTGKEITSIAAGIDARVFHSGVDGSSIRRELTNGIKVPLIVCVSQIMEAKGQIDLVESLPLLVKEVPDFRLVFVGGTNGMPGNEAYLGRLRRRLQDLELESYVSFIGARSDIAPFFAAADVVVYPSHGESFGLVPIEANAVGTPVVSSDVGIARQLAAQRPAVEVVKPRRPDEMASAILRGLNCKRVTEPVCREWTIEGSVDKIESILKQATGTRR
jgi:glycosyltransferase involved in cell wall biosynthesis